MPHRLRPSAAVTFAADLAFESVSHDYHGRRTVEGISLRVEPGEILCLLGPSGSGKTTLLRLAAGIEGPKSGRILLNDREIAGPNVFVPPERRGVGLMFQDFALFPHMSVFENVRFGLNALSRDDSKREAMATLTRVGLARHAERYPYVLSGGEQQRVALARALSPRPSVLLMDEPFSGLDSRLKDRVRDETLAVLRETRATTVIVTHDAEEAMRMADRIALMRDGRLAQVGTAEALYRKPADLFTAAFFSELNVFEAVARDGVVGTPLGSFAAGEAQDGERLAVAVRPSAIHVSETGGALPARIVFRRFLGVVEQLGLAVPGTEQVVKARIRAGRLPPPARDVALCVDERDVMLFKDVKIARD